jgi:predicted nucleotide-binding protein (sugar kinase/HSP70/actin superfamily)
LIKEKIIKEIFSETGLYEYHLTDMKQLIEVAKGVLSPQLTGEAILTIGEAINTVVNDVDGVIIIGPFGCMPHRVAESILNESLEKEKKKVTANEKVGKVLQSFSSLPFLAIEVDGSVFTQIIEARLESFCLQVERLNEYRKSV